MVHVYVVRPSVVDAVLTCFYLDNVRFIMSTCLFGFGNYSQVLSTVRLSDFLLRHT